MRLVVQPLESVENKTTNIDVLYFFMYFYMIVHSSRVHTTCSIQETVHISTNAVENVRFVVLVIRGCQVFVLSLWIQILPEKALHMDVKV